MRIHLSIHRVNRSNAVDKNIAKLEDDVRAGMDTPVHLAALLTLSRSAKGLRCRVVTDTLHSRGNHRQGFKP
jgi:hypothetical protein